MMFLPIIPWIRLYLLNPDIMGGFSSHLPDFSTASWLADSTYHLLPSSPNFCSTHLKADVPDGKV